MKSQIIYETLKKRLLQGVYAPGSRFPSEDTLLEEFSVCKVTINKIVTRLAAEGLLVRGVRGAGTRVVQQMFRPRGLIGFVGKLNAYSMEILRGVQEECLHQELFPVVFSPSSGELQYTLSILHKKNVEGIITIGYGVLRPEEKDLALVCLDYLFPRQNSTGNIHFIASDDHQGGRAMMEEILRRGHRRIAIFSAERFIYGTDAPVTARVKGFHQALEEAGFPDYQSRTFYGMPHSLPDAKRCLKQIMEKYGDCSVICTDSDISAELMARAAESLHISCPGRIALTGFGNVTSLPIASVDQHPVQQGIQAVRYIASGMGKGFDSNSFSPTEELLETSLVNTDRIPITV